MKRSLATLLVTACLAAGCASLSSAAHGHRRYTQPSEAMEPTIHVGQTFEVRPVEPGRYVPKRGDVVIFTMRSWAGDTGKSFVKRVVAVGGDSIACCSPQGRVLLNGAALPEPYLAPDTPENRFDMVRVPPGRLWMMGDNRPVSLDSRGHMGDDTNNGTVPVAAVTGVAVLGQG